MRTELPDDVIVKYQQDGFVYVPQFLSAKEVTELRSAVLDAVGSMGRRKVSDGSIDSQEKDDFYDKVFTQRLNLWKINSTVKRYMLDSQLGRLLCRFADVAGMRVWHDQALIKEPFGNATAWHLDNPYWSFSSPNSISIWIALEDATWQNGCMYFIPGSQHLARYENVSIGVNMGELFKIYPEMAKTDPVGVPMKAGDCSFHNGLTAHGAGCNMTRGRRIAMTCAYMPAGSTFNGQRNILPEPYFKSLKVGDELKNEEHNPLVWPTQQR